MLGELGVRGETSRQEGKSDRGRGKVRRLSVNRNINLDFNMMSNQMLSLFYLVVYEQFLNAFKNGRKKAFVKLS